MQDSDSYYEKKKESVKEMMKDKHMVERYSKHLNHCLLSTTDNFIRRKHEVYLTQTGQSHGDNFFKR